MAHKPNSLKSLQHRRQELKTKAKQLEAGPLGAVLGVVYEVKRYNLRRQIKQLILRSRMKRKAAARAACTRCAARPEQHKLFGRKYYRCQVCQDVDCIVGGIDTIVGELPLHHMPGVMGAELHTAVWQSQKSLPYPAQPDVLHIYPNKQLAYEETISKLILNWENQQLQLREVVLRGDPPLTDNALRMLRDFCSTISVK